jgi:hypothetical protein
MCGAHKDISNDTKTTFIGELEAKLQRFKELGPSQALDPPGGAQGGPSPKSEGQN